MPTINPEQEVMKAATAMLTVSITNLLSLRYKRSLYQAPSPHTHSGNTEKDLKSHP